MDPLSIAASSFQIAGGIAKAFVVIFEFSRDVRDAAADLSRVNAELQALSSILDPLTRALSRSPAVPERLAGQLQSTLEGCSLVVGQISELVGKYRRQGSWSKAKWAMFGSGDVDKLRESLEAYKMVLSLGFHLLSASLQEDIKDDTGAIRGDTQIVRQYASEIKISTDQILARVNSIRNGRGSGGATRIEQWMEQMEVLTSYAETTYQETILDPGEWAANSPGRSPETPTADTPVPEGKGVLRGQQEDEGSATLPSHQADKSVSIPLPDEGNNLVSGLTSEQFTPITRKSLPSVYPQDGNNPPAKMLEDFELDVLVAIDIGELSTAVSWLSRDVAGGAIKQWPGGTGPRVPTSVIYSPGGDLSSWGYLCANDAVPEKKPWAACISLTGALLGLSGDAEVDRLRLHMTHFLHELCRHIKATVMSRLGTRRSSWEEVAIEFHFTLPDRIRLVEPAVEEAATRAFTTIIRNAGFLNSERHCAILRETETEAVVMATASEKPEGASTIMIIKVGESNIALAKRDLRRAPRMVTLTTSLNTTLSDAMVEQIRKQANNYTQVVIVETSAVAQRAFTSQVVQALGKLEVCALRRYDAGAGATGLIYRRNPWGRADQPQLHFVGSSTLGFLVRMLVPSATLDVKNVLKAAEVCPLPWGTEVGFEAQTARGQRPRRATVQFNVTFAPGKRGQDVLSDAGEPVYIGREQVTCSVKSWVDVEHFQALKTRERWYSIRTTYLVRIALRIFVTDQNRVGPQFRVYALDRKGQEVAREAKVTWYRDPQHIALGRAGTTI